jgi:transposase
MVTVGIDPHKRVHVAVAVDARGNRIGKPLTVKNDGLLIIALLTWIRSITDSTSVTWAIEDGRGFARRLADGLLLAGQEVVWVSQPADRRASQVARRYGLQIGCHRRHGGSTCRDRDTGSDPPPH